LACRQTDGVIDAMFGLGALVGELEEKQMLPRETSMPLPSWRRSLSLAVTAAIRAPARANWAKIVSPRSSSGPVITTASPVAGSR
jgi:hypothetical protein